jgi:hypothetical protein
MLAKNRRPQFLPSYHGRTGGLLVRLGRSMTFALSQCGHVIAVLTVTSLEGAMLIDGHGERLGPVLTPFEDALPSAIRAATTPER